MILAVVGMKREARLLARIGVRAVVGGGDSSGLREKIERALCSPPPCGEGSGVGVHAPKRADFSSLPPSPCPLPRRRGGEGSWSAILSFGVAGGLDPSLKAGDVVIASGVWTPKQSPDSPDRPTSPLPVDPTWADRLLWNITGARSGLIAGQDTPAASVEDKSALHAATGALAVDMESHIAAEAAARYGIPFAAIRAISDPADHALPPAAIAGFGADGDVDLLAVLRALARDPRQTPALIRTGREANLAFNALAEALRTNRTDVGLRLQV